jgi:hypothetical protein
MGANNYLPLQQNTISNHSIIINIIGQTYVSAKNILWLNKSNNCQLKTLLNFSLKIDKFTFLIKMDYEKNSFLFVRFSYCC